MWLLVLQTVFRVPKFGGILEIKSISNMMLQCIPGVIMVYKIHLRSLFYPLMPTLFCVAILIKTAEKPKVHFYACYLVNMHLFMCILSLE